MTQSQPSSQLISVQDLAQRWGMIRNDTKSWCGKNPTGEGAGEDGFLLFDEGNAWDRSGKGSKEKYNSVEVALMAGIEPNEYEPVYNHRMQTGTLDNNRTFSGQGRSGPQASLDDEPTSAPKPATKPPKKFDKRTLEQRGIKQLTFDHFHIEATQESWRYPTFQADGSNGRSREKFFDPEAAGLKYAKNKKPIKYRWVPGDDDPIPAAYNLSACIGQVEIWLVGGEVDVWTCQQVGIKAISGFGEKRKVASIIEAAADLGIEKIHIALDNDETGHGGALDAVDACIQTGVAYTVREVMGVVGADVNDYCGVMEYDPKRCYEAIVAMPHATKATLDRWRGFGQQDEKKEGVSASKKGASKDEKMAKTERLVHLLHDSEIYISDEEEDLYIGLTGSDGVNRTFPSGDANLRAYLFDNFFEQTGTAISKDVVENTMEILRGRALRLNNRRDVFVRVGKFEDSIFLDLCDREVRVVEINPKFDDGWRVIQGQDCPVSFRRPKGMEPLPVPVRGGKITALRDIINSEDDDSWKLMLGWLIFTVYPSPAKTGKPYPALSLNGEAGTAKSTTSRILRRIVDPNFTTLVSGTSLRDERDLAIMAKNCHILGFDNLSGLSKWMSDSLSQIATEGAIRLRKNYSDDQEMLFKARRPMILNGIDALMGKEDFQNRSLICTLPVITSETRREDEEIWNTFHKIWPAMVGAICTITATAMKEIDKVVMPRKPRMADFAKWIVAAEQGGALPWKSGDFMETFFTNLQESQETAVSMSPLANEMMKMMEKDGFLEINATDLLKKLNDQASFDAKSSPGWPLAPNGLTAQLNRMAQNLRAVGIDVRNTRSGHHRARVLKIMKIDREQPDGSPE